MGRAYNGGKERSCQSDDILPSIPNKKYIEKTDIVSEILLDMGYTYIVER